MTVIAVQTIEPTAWPLVLDASNAFSFNGQSYTVASGTYTTAAALVAAINAAVQTGDATRFDAVCTATLAADGRTVTYSVASALPCYFATTAQDAIAARITRPDGSRVIDLGSIS